MRIDKVLIFGTSVKVCCDICSIFPYGGEKATAEAIKKALNAPEEMRKKARERIKRNFSLERREKELIKIVKRI